ncbi:unnamed protein product [Ambrosiozyma monospora]|uniref:Unnamed protein product n=1 Tax=Ambrosiozyma monospora TaxID=43982 RepID=A0ACB5T037_AMBMO|nr:unnamed protein product [Ambrosiozyma monospora]
MKKQVDRTCGLRPKLEDPKDFYSWFKTFQFDLKLLGLTNIAKAAIKPETNLSEHHDKFLEKGDDEKFIREYMINTIELKKGRHL